MNFIMIQFIWFEFVSKSIATPFISNGSNLLIWLTHQFGWVLIVDLLKGFRMTSRIVDFCVKEDILQNGKSLHGVIIHLVSKCGGNVHDQGLIASISSTIYGSSPSCCPKDATNLHNRSSFLESNSESNSWIYYDFNEWKLHQLTTQSFLIRQINTIIRIAGEMVKLPNLELLIKFRWQPAFKVVRGAE
jgi:hypothetical protein